MAFQLARKMGRLLGKELGLSMALSMAVLLGLSSGKYLVPTTETLWVKELSMALTMALPMGW